MSIKSLALLLALLLLSVTTGVWLYSRAELTELTIAAGPRHGEAFELMKALAGVVHRHHENIRIEVLETGGSAQNMALLDAGKVDLATVQALTPSLPAARLVAHLYPEMFQILVSTEYDINTVADLRNATVGVPVEGSGDAESFRFLVDHYQLTGVTALPMETNAAKWALIDDRIDAIFRVSAPGNHGLQAVVDKFSTRLIPVDQAAAMQLKKPALDPGFIPKGSYQGHPPLPEEDLETAAVQRSLIAQKDVDSAAVNAVTAVLFERRRDLVALSPLAGFIAAPDQDKGTLLPIHEGARQFYERDEPSFLQEQAEPIALLMSILAVTISGLLQLASKRKRQRLDRYNKEALELGEMAHQCEHLNDVRECEQQLVALVRHVVTDVEKGRIASDGLDVFTFAWETSLGIIKNREDTLRSGIEHGTHDAQMVKA